MSMIKIDLCSSCFLLLMLAKLHVRIWGLYLVCCWELLCWCPFLNLNLMFVVGHCYDPCHCYVLIIRCFPSAFNE